MFKSLVLTTCICTALAGTALAQTSGSFNQAGVQAIDAKTVKMTFYEVSPADMLASNFIGSEVRNNQNNEEIGEIEDLIIDQGKTIRGVVLSVGGFLGLGERRVAVDPGSLVIRRESSGSMQVVSNTTKDELNKAPEFKYEKNLQRDNPEAVSQPAGTRDPGAKAQQ
jgi:sporulation protein YlmC with PRC-barrel domain